MDDDSVSSIDVFIYVYIYVVYRSLMLCFYRQSCFSMLGT